MKMNSNWRLAASSALAASLFGATGVANVAYAADAVAMLRNFVKDVQTARANFTQVVTSPDGKKTRKSTGTLEFQRPDKFRFAYAGPTEQLIVGDGKKVWLYDTDLNQVTVRPMSATIGASPAALLAGGSLDKDFTLKAVAVTAGSSSAATATSTPSQATSSLEWVEALPRHKDGQFQSVRVGFTKNGQLAALEILDSFGQRSRLDFAQFESKVVFPTTRFQFTPPAGADVLNQP
ncbi:outer membrane lipoprotein chaperone LolA [Aquabacterium sp.]|uniref:outer membrane lipoprotein chaperone LolA n=1 Tax=Aquabacterium sp. TaxID=1872578 RepID=UPI0025BBA02A|nr:outer membrane lipoprotein chaperone LolA [Aquabacterium sp.]